MRPFSDRYDALTITLHWMIAILILGLLAVGFVMTRGSIDPGLQFSLFQWHKSFGMLVLLLAIFRLFHSWLFVRVRPVAGTRRWEHVAASGTHRALLALAILVPLAGWMVASVSALDIPTFAFNLIVIPHLPVAKSDAGEEFWGSVHAILAYATLALVALHSAAALYHHYRRRDETLMRMLTIRRVVTETPVRERREP
jgi:cytochrome b561